MQTSFPPILPKDRASTTHLPGTSPPGLGNGTRGGWTMPPWRKKVHMACNTCRANRIKCDGSKPSCSTCCARGRQCEYAEFDRRTKMDLKSYIRNLEMEKSNLQIIVQQLQYCRTPEAIEHLKRIRQSTSITTTTDTNPSPPSGIEGGGGGGGGGGGAGGGRISLPRRPSGTYFASETIPEQEECIEIERFDTGFGMIPCRAITGRTVAAFFACMGTLVHIEGEDVAARLIEHVYQGPCPDVQSVCELCAIAAVGGQVDGDGVPTGCKNEYFGIAILLLCDTLERDTKQGIRVIICLVTYMILTNIKSARAFIDCGLSLARRVIYRLNHLGEAHQDERLQTLRLFQTLITLESWLSVNLNYNPTLTLEEAQSISIYGAEAFPSPSPPTIQFQFNKLAVLSARIHTQLRNSAHLPWQSIAESSQTLETWRYELPEAFHLSALLPQNLQSDPGNENERMPPSIRRCLLLLHIVYLESHILLYERFIRRCSPQTEITAIDEAIRRKYAGFARQLSQIIAIIHGDKTGFVQSWILMYLSPPFLPFPLLLLKLAVQKLTVAATHPSTQAQPSF
ncbi:hypothetical protein BJX61DRAFT_135284 [Aspergillus egyptiacus]|nr:hypothetical protein BJX61DRAFT_135284 [Aspergillus egyptiacus]